LTRRKPQSRDKPLPVKQLRITPGIGVSRLIREMGATGVLGAGRMGLALDVMEEMYSNPDYTNILTIAGPIVPSGFRHVIGDMIDRGFLDAIVTTGANLTHDVVEALGGHHYQGTFNVDDRKLIGQGYNRIADIFVREDSFIQLDKKVRRMIGRIPEDERKRIACSHLLEHLGKLLKDQDSILYKAARKSVHVFSPGLLDSILGLSIWGFSTTQTLQLDPFIEVKRKVDMAMTSKRVGSPDHDGPSRTRRFERRTIGRID